VTAFRPCALVPLYNHADTVPSVVARLRAHLDDVFVVDDGSTDAGPAGIDPFPGLRVLRHPANRGKGAAVRTGLAAARLAGFTHVLQVDADDQHDLADVPRFLDLARANPDAVLAGERLFEGHVPRSSRFGRAFGMFWYRVETWPHPLKDTQCGFRGYPADLLERVPVRGDRMQFDVEVLVRSVWAGLPVLGVPTRVRYGAPGEHRSHFRPFLDNVLMTGLHTRLTVLRGLRALGLAR